MKNVNYVLNRKLHIEIWLSIGGYLNNMEATHQSN